MLILLYVFLLSYTTGTRLIRRKEPPGSVIHSWVCEDQCCSAVPACNVTTPTKTRSLDACLHSLRDDCTVTINGTYTLIAEDYVCVGSKSFGFDFSFLEGENARFLSDLNLNHVGLILNFAGGGTFTSLVRTVECHEGERITRETDSKTGCVYIDYRGEELSPDQVQKLKASQQQYLQNVADLSPVYDYSDNSMQNGPTVMQNEDHPHNYKRATNASYSYFRAMMNDQYDRLGLKSVVGKKSKQDQKDKKISEFSKFEAAPDSEQSVSDGEMETNSDNSNTSNNSTNTTMVRDATATKTYKGHRSVFYQPLYWADFSGHNKRVPQTVPAIEWASLNDEVYSYVNTDLRDSFSADDSFISKYGSRSWGAGRAGPIQFPRASNGDGQEVVDSRILYYPARVWQAETLTHGCTGMMTYGTPVSVTLRHWAHNFGLLEEVVNDPLNPIYIVIPTQYTPFKVKDYPVWLFDINTRLDQQAHLQKWSRPPPFTQVSIESQKRGLLKSDDSSSPI